MISLLPTDSRSRWALVASAVIAIPLVIVAFWLWEGYRASPALQFEGVKLQVLEGEGVPAAGGVSIRTVSPQGRAMIAIPVGVADAARYPLVSFTVVGLDRAGGAGVYWTNTDKPGVGHPRPLSLEEARSGVIRLQGDPRWQGSIESLGFIIQGPLAQEVLFQSIGLSSDSVSFLDVAQRLKLNWLALANWDGGSVNFHIGASRTERIMTPVLSVFLWAVLTFSLFIAFLRFGRFSSAGATLSLFVTLLLGAWALLDLRWQAELVGRHFNSEEDVMLAADQRRREALSKLREEFNGFGQARILLVSHDPSGYVAYRTRYHLGAARTSFAMDRLPTPAERRPGDYLLLMSSTEPLTVDKARGFVSSQTESIPVDFLKNAPEAGVLMRVRLGG
jgi:hypothetical protein